MLYFSYSPRILNVAHYLYCYYCPTLLSKMDQVNRRACSLNGVCDRKLGSQSHLLCITWDGMCKRWMWSMAQTPTKLCWWSGGKISLAGLQLWSSKCPESIIKALETFEGNGEGFASLTLSSQSQWYFKWEQVTNEKVPCHWIIDSAWKVTAESSQFTVYNLLMPCASLDHLPAGVSP